MSSSNSTSIAAAATAPEDSNKFDFGEVATYDRWNMSFF